MSAIYKGGVYLTLKSVLCNCAKVRDGICLFVCVCVCAFVDMNRLLHTIPVLLYKNHNLNLFWNERCLNLRFHKQEKLHRRNNWTCTIGFWDLIRKYLKLGLKCMIHLNFQMNLLGQNQVECKAETKSTSTYPMEI